MVALVGDVASVVVAWCLLTLAAVGLITGIILGLNALARPPLADWIAGLSPLADDYDHVALELVGSVRPIGLVVGGRLGHWMHDQVPGFFADPGNAGSLVNLQVDPGSPLAGVYLANLLTAALIGVGGVIVLASRRLSRRWRIAGGTALAYALVSVALQPWTMADLEWMGLTLILTKIWEVQWDVYLQVRSIWGQVTPNMVRNGGAALLVVLAGLAILGIASLRGWSGARIGRVVSSAAVVLLVCGLLSGFALRGSLVYATEEAFDEVALGVPAEADGLAWRCMGYNSIPAEPAAQRPARLERDFARIRALGFTTINGWESGLFDRELLDAAQRHGLNVIFPIELMHAAIYLDEGAVAEQHREVMARFHAYRDHPAIVAWGLGNEVFFALPKGPAGVPQREAFARHLVRMADEMHAADPARLISYRDFETGSADVLLAALTAGDAPRPWFAYGMNGYKFRTSEELRRDIARLGMPFYVSEFAPTSMRPEDRPLGYLRFWRLYQENADVMLGGCAYVWSTAGPDLHDRIYGLVDGAGVAVDHSLGVLAGQFRRPPQGQR